MKVLVIYWLTFFCYNRYLGDEYGVISVAKYSENGELLHLPYNISPSSLAGDYCICLLKLNCNMLNIFY